MAKLPATKGGKIGPHGCVTPAVTSANLVKRTIERVLPLGTSTVTTATYAIGLTHVAGEVIAIRYAGQSAVTGTTLTAEVKKVAADGSASTTLQSAATDIKLTSANDDEAVPASLTATTDNLTFTADQVIECVVTASSVSAGPGDLIVQVVYVPSEDTPNGSGLVTTGADL